VVCVLGSLVIMAVLASLYAENERIIHRGTTSGPEGGITIPSDRNACEEPTSGRQVRSVVKNHDGAYDVEATGFSATVKEIEISEGGRILSYVR